jgi:hypothetical protein
MVSTSPSLSQLIELYSSSFDNKSSVYFQFGNAVPSKMFPELQNRLFNAHFKDKFK